MVWVKVQGLGWIMMVWDKMQGLGWIIMFWIRVQGLSWIITGFQQNARFGMDHNSLGSARSGFDHNGFSTECKVRVDSYWFGSICSVWHLFSSILLWPHSTLSCMTKQIYQMLPQNHIKGYKVKSHPIYVLLVSLWKSQLRQFCWKSSWFVVLAIFRQVHRMTPKWPPEH